MGGLYHPCPIPCQTAFIHKLWEKYDPAIMANLSRLDKNKNRT